jgi:uncharacterized membrane protein YeaQ/YmgE (transglycosylase-associated protein family)
MGSSDGWPSPVEGAALEMPYSRKAVLGSNPNPSANSGAKLLPLLREAAHPATEMAININGTVINLDWGTVLVWCLVGLVAGFFASRVALGHGLGLFGDIAVGILGAFLAGIISSVFHINVQIAGHPIITEMVVAFVGAVILLLVVRLVSGGGRKQHRAS